MRLPDNAESIVESVCADSRQLIDRGFWDIQTPRFDSWYRQFCGAEEQFFAACLLDHVIYRTRQQFEAGLRSLFRSNLCGTLFTDVHDLHLIEILRGGEDPKLRLIPVICETDPPTKSGPLVMRRLQRILQINQKWMCWPWQAANAIDEKAVETILFVDDFLGTGGQFVNFFQQWGFDKQQAAGIKHVYAPVVAHQQGIDHLAKELSSVCVVSAETLGHSHGFFSEKVWNRLGQGCVSADDAKSWYMDFGAKRDFKSKSVSLLGYGELALSRRSGG